MLHAVKLKKPAEADSGEARLVQSYLGHLAVNSMGIEVRFVPEERDNIEITSANKRRLKEFIKKSDIGRMKPNWTQVESTRP